MELIIIVIIFIGVLMSLVNLPGSFVVIAAMFINNIFSSTEQIPYWVIFILLFLAILGTLVDNVFMLYGANKYGASKWGMIGIFFGFIIGLISANPVIIIIGPFALAYLFESLIAQKDHDSAINAVKGSVIGGFAGYLVKLFLTIFVASIYFFILI